MNKNIILLFFMWISGFICANAHIDVVYPVEKNLTINASSIFFIGNTTTGSTFTINSSPVKLWNDNFFVQVIPVNIGKNTIQLVSKHNGIQEEKTYTVNRLNNKTGANTSKISYESLDYILSAKTIKNNSTIREKPSNYANRVIDLPKNVVLFLSARHGDYYKIEETGESEFWIHKSNIENPVKAEQRVPLTMEEKKEYSDKYYNYVKFSLNYPVLYSLKQNDKSIELTIFGLNNYKYTYKQDLPILGYEAYYENNNLILRVAKNPKIQEENYPLKDITIFVDAGHGGSEKGSVGPTRVTEKDVNLAISKYLMKYLKEERANVIISRTDDIKIGLYERVDMARENNALISVSIHNNALPIGKDPYKNHGSEVHYYNENAKLLSEIILEDLVQNLYFKDNGIHKSSFALNRSTNPVSVLVECAYMINPEEYIRLKNPAVQKQIAKSIKNSLKKYIIMIQR